MPRTDPVPRLMAVTGILYLVIFCLGLSSELVVRGGLIVPGDAAATANNILAYEWLFKAGFAGDLLVFLCDVAVAMLLYVLLLPAGKTASLVSSGFRLAGTAIYGANLLNYYAPLLILGGSGSMDSFNPEQLNSLALLFLEIHKHGYDLGLVFFGAHCLVLGYLLFRSPDFPKILGIFMFLAGAAYVAGSLTLFLWPRYTAAVEPIYALPVIGELSLCLWLLLRGARGKARAA